MCIFCGRKYNFDDFYNIIPAGFCLCGEENYFIPVSASPYASMECSDYFINLHKGLPKNLQKKVLSDLIQEIEDGMQEQIEEETKLIFID